MLRQQEHRQKQQQLKIRAEIEANRMKEEEEVRTVVWLSTDASFN